jgi:alkylation response protein AidB-like acyl-CoA dehydrogenase
MKNGSGIHISAEDMAGYQDLARQFAKKSLLPVFEGEHSDGNLSLLPEKLATAFTIGIAASPDTSMAGSQYGIWGSATDDYGLTPSMALLSIIAETCGGIAMCLNAQGVASNLVLHAKDMLPFTPVQAGLCLQEGPYPPSLGTILSPASDAPARIATTAVQEGSGYIINGAKSFVYSMDNPDAYAVFAVVKERWGCFLVPADDRRVTRTDAGLRTGLRACRVEHVEFHGVPVPGPARIDDGNARDLACRALCLNWAGMSAIAVGIARGAAAAARKYASERYQGGALIEEHPAIKMLIAGAEAAAAASESTVHTLDDDRSSSLAMLGKAAAAKLMVMELCARAVTDCLQAFGGYGYMEDFGMEKRLRDMAVLKSSCGPPSYLKQLIFDIERGENL